MWKAKNARDPPRAGSLGMAVVIKGGDAKDPHLCADPQPALPLTERQLGKLCAHGGGRWWPGKEEDPAHNLHGLQNTQVSPFQEASGPFRGCHSFSAPFPSSVHRTDTMHASDLESSFQLPLYTGRSWAQKGLVTSCSRSHTEQVAEKIDSGLVTHS